MASIYLNRDWNVPTLDELDKIDYEEWKDSSTDLHERTLSIALHKIEQLFPDLVRNAIDVVKNTQAHYWHQKDQVFFRICASGELDERLKILENELAR